MRRAHHWTVATVLLTTVGAAVTLTAGPALAAASSNATSVVRAADPPPFPRTLKLTGAVSQVQTTATIGPATFNPLRGYPTAVTTRSWTPARSPDGTALKAGIYSATTGTGESIMLYCADATTATSPGVNYRISAVRTATTPNLGYVGTIIMNNYPITDAPASLSSTANKAAAVQLAIWFFTNRLVVDATSPLRAATEAIVNQALRRGPLTNAGVPDLMLNGPARGYVGRANGPFTMRGGVGDIIISSSGGTLFRDAAGTRPIANGSVISSSTPIYLKAGEEGRITIRARGAARVPAGAEVVYAPTTQQPGQVTAQIALYQTMVMASWTQQQAEDTMAVMMSTPVSSSVPGAAQGSVTKTPQSASNQAGAAAGAGTLPVTPAGERAPVGAMLIASGLLIGLGAAAVAAGRRRRATP
ncbi:hypothetical protein GCM10009682_06240 [Luedemannella flava]|uniref:Thioester domain-containing protein n=2 Tax=Luedemannella flava TaxID=349316 RepID=A0ABP4XNV2_9ACTN